MPSVLTDSLEKVLGPSASRPAARIDGVHAAGFLGEPLMLQLAVLLPTDGAGAALSAADPAPERTHLPAPCQVAGPSAAVRVRIDGDLAAHTTVRAVRRVPVSLPAPEDPDPHYLVTEPGDYPDLLEPVGAGPFPLAAETWESLWIEVLVDDEALAGDHTLRLAVLRDADGAVLAEETAELRIHPFTLPPLAIVNTHWFTPTPSLSTTASTRSRSGTGS